MRTAPSTLALALLCMGRVDGHGHLVDPMPSWVNPNGDLTAFCDVLDGPSLLPGGPYNLGPADNANMFASNFKTSSYSSIRDFVKKNSPTCGACGLTKIDGGAPQQLNPAGTIQWKHGGEGFTQTHHGPCEVWCDDSMAFHDDNCALNKPTGLLNLDMEKCASAKKLVMYWLALHSPQWQVYLNCVALSPTNSDDVNSTVTSPSPTVSSATRNPRTTKAPPTTSSASPTKSPITITPSATTPLPSTGASHPTTTPRKTTRFPPQTTPSPRTSTPYPTPLSSMPSGDVAQPWHQCGGQGYTGPTTCAKGFECIQLEPKWYSQCLSHRPVPSKEYDTWEQCGGMTFTKSMTCKAGDVCYRRNDYFSQCVPL